MLSSKQRSYLSHLSNELPDIIFIGKNGITEEVVNQVINNLKARELIKGKVQLNCPLDPKTVANELALKTKSDVVRVIGKKFILYKKNQNKKNNIIPNKKSTIKSKKRRKGFRK